MVEVAVLGVAVVTGPVVASVGTSVDSGSEGVPEVTVVVVAPIALGAVADGGAVVDTIWSVLFRMLVVSVLAASVMLLDLSDVAGAVSPAGGAARVDLLFSPVVRVLWGLWVIRVTSAVLVFLICGRSGVIV